MRCKTKWDWTERERSFSVEVAVVTFYMCEFEVLLPPLPSTKTHSVAIYFSISFGEKIELFCQRLGYKLKLYRYKQLMIDLPTNSDHPM